MMSAANDVSDEMKAASFVTLETSPLYIQHNTVSH